MLSESWPAIYGSQAALAATALFLFARRQAGAMFTRRLVLLVIGAWLGELLALTVFGQLLANEIDPEIAWFFRLMGTGGPISQPRPHLAAMSGYGATALEPDALVCPNRMAS